MKNRTWKWLKSFVPKAYEVIVSVPIFIIGVFIVEYYHIDTNHGFWWVAGVFLCAGIISQIGMHAMQGLLMKEYDKGYDNGYADGEHDSQNLSKKD